MLTTLRIKNLALVADLTLELRSGFNVITGETGAGKSILIGALNLLLGGRADRTLLRSGSESCSVEAVFEVRRLKAPLPHFLAENGLEACEEDQLVLKRTFTAAGANRQYVNGSPTSLGTLATIGEWLVDIHGPHEHQSLLHPAKQLAILDAFGGLGAQREQFAEWVRARSELERRKTELVVDEASYAQQLDLLRFQTREIAAAQVQSDEEEKLTQDYRRASNAARLIELGQKALEVLSEHEQSVLNQVALLGRTLQELRRLDAGAQGMLEAHSNAGALLRELQSELSRYTERIDLDPARLGELEERLNVIQSLKRKYGATLAEVLAFGTEAGRKLQALEARDEELSTLNAELKKVEQQLWRAGEALSTARRKLVPPLGRSVEQQLTALGFQQSRLEIAVSTISREAFEREPARIPPGGLDAIEFLFAPNPGEPPRPLRAIASSGELARVMLALKTVLAVEDEIPVLVFDEVDANVGGETANAVGEKMRQIARERQVLCVTHLAPVAAPADAHFLVSKEVRDGRTVSEIAELKRDERVRELARMLGGQTATARQHAAALLAAAE